MYAMANYQQPNPHNNLQYWHQMQQHMKNQQAQQQLQQQQLLEQQGYVKKKNCNCGGKKKNISDQQNQG
ncbi:cytochrome C oxidase subunit III [Bacillus pseudomycoides]|nr:cytochrome C oxidase subunit III [Bacillus pseudomycoides]PGA95209.1 cytochrome C oxidase subunit III [Bacillus pseudomycoides]PHF52180.1 cytochrome C oxidase subunit III [Bacillus pseudomycoides]